MEVHPGVFVSSTLTDAWRSDPEVGGGAEEHVLSEVQIEIEGGPTLELKPGDMASLPKGAVTRWHLKLPFKEMWVLAGA